MKKIVLLLALVMTSMSFAQIDDNWEDVSEKLPGYIITNKGEKIEGYLKRFLKIKSQRKVKFFKTLDDKPVTYGPKDLKAYKIENDYYESHPYEGLSGKTKVFLLRTVEGKISLFDYYIRVEDDQGNELLLSKDGNKEVSLDFDPALVGELSQREIDLIYRITTYEGVLREAAKDYSPAVIAQYAYDLAKEYNGFYQEVPIFNEENKDKIALRVQLSSLTAVLIKKSMGLLGTEVPERM